MSDFRVGDAVRWKPSLARGATVHPVFEVTETGLQSSYKAMPGARIRVRKADGGLTVVWESDVELVPGAKRGPAKKARRAKCPYCSRTVSVRISGRVHAHTIKGTGGRCGGSGQFAS